MTFTAAFALLGPDVPKLAEVLRIRDQDADRLKNYMMNHKPLTPRQHKHINQRCRQMVARHALRLVRGKAQVAA